MKSCVVYRYIGNSKKHIKLFESLVTADNVTESFKNENIDLTNLVILEIKNVSI